MWELENVIERALIINSKGPVTFEHFNPEQPEKLRESCEEREETDNLVDTISRHIRRVLLKTNGRVNGPDGAASILGVNPSTLRNSMKKFVIDYGFKNKNKI